MTGDSHIVSVGVIGAGQMGGLHASNLQSKISGARVAAVMDVDQGRADKLAAACGATLVLTDSQQLIQAEQVDAVIVTSPADTHAGLVLECLSANKPVFCEKPLATTSTDAWQIVAEEANLGNSLVQIGFVRRFDNLHRDVKDVVESGDIGCPTLFRGWHRYQSAPVPSKEMLADAAIHDLDSVRWLLGQDIEEVFVTSRTREKALDQDSHDLLLLQMSLAGGCLASIVVNASTSYGYDVGVEVVGERGTALAGPPMGVFLRKDHMHVSRIDASWRERFREGYLAELEAWIASIRSGRHVGPGAWDGYLSMLAAEGCEAAFQSGAPYRLRPARRPSIYREV